MIKTFKLKIFIILFFVSTLTLSSSFIVRHYFIEETKKYIDGKREDNVYIFINEIERDYAKTETFEKIGIDKIFYLAEKLHLNFVIFDLEEKVILKLNSNNLSSNYEEYPLFYKRKQIGTVRISFNEEERINVLIDRSKKILLFSVLLTLITIGVISIIISERLTKPLKELTKSAKEISKGNLNVNTNVKSKDEIGKLSQAFNEMVKRLKRLEDIRKRNITNLSHEIRTPLTILKGNLMGIKDGLIVGDDKVIDSLLEEVDKIESLTEGIKRLGDIDESLFRLRLEKANLKELTENSIENIKILLEKKTLNIEASLDDLEIEVDKKLYKQLVTNLLSNAIKASSEKDKILVKIDKEKGELIVKDFGTGIEKKDIDLIFERFYKKFRDGSGVGLTIVKEIADAHNWKIYVNSKMGEGTEFIIKFQNS